MATSLDSKRLLQDENPILENVKTIIIALAIALVIRAFIFQPFNIPSGSMMPTLLRGDFIFVSKFSYGYSRYSLPLSPPLLSGRLFGAAPERGDVVVFRNFKDKDEGGLAALFGGVMPWAFNGKDYIKRVIGLPGDRIQMIEGVLHINGAAVKRERIEDFLPEPGTRYRGPVQRVRETLPNGVAYVTLDLCPPGAQQNGCSFGRGDRTAEFVVPAGHYFMMGDNRDDSQDSRFAEAVGFVPEEALVGKAQVIFLSLDGSARLWELWRWPFAVRWGRLLDGVD